MRARTQRDTAGEENPGYGKRISRVQAPVGDAEEMVFPLIRRQGGTDPDAREGAPGRFPRGVRERGIPKTERR